LKLVEENSCRRWWEYWKFSD